ncbi:hypothetical protein [Priestia koreensis]|uniref:hypothetical protein n=1 Tax=Priestia koreensis TaxID=284581 RepID=UPI0034579F71
MKQNKWFLLAVISSVLVILYEFFKWEIVDVITEFVLLPLAFILFGFFIVVTIKAVIELVKHRDWKPLTVQVVTIALLFLVPFNQIILRVDFELHQSKREEVVKKIKSGELSKNVSDQPTLITLPSKFKNLSSDGGEVVVAKTSGEYSTLFFTYLGAMDNFSGFVYVPTHKKPSGKAFDAHFREITKMDQNWYFVSSY